MPRANYMTISAHETVQRMFDEFVSRSGLTKTVALSEMLEAYMLAKDEGLYLELKHKYLNTEAIRQKITKQEWDNIMEEFIIMRLSNSVDNQGNDCDGWKTMQEYSDDEKDRGFTWFSTNALYAGMAQDKVKRYNSAINNGKKVTLLFAIGKGSEGTNEIVFKANVLEIKSSRQPEEMPINEYPALFHGSKATIWIKVDNLQPESDLKASMFKFTESGEDLQDVIIGKNQFAFGYVTLK